MIKIREKAFNHRGRHSRIEELTMNQVEISISRFFLVTLDSSDEGAVGNVLAEIRKKEFLGMGELGQQGLRGML